MHERTMAIHKFCLVAIVASVLLTLSLAFANGLKPEIVEGSCKDFNNALAKGVKAADSDPEETREPKRAGVTRATTTWKAGIQERYEPAQDEHCSSFELKKSPITMVNSSRFLSWKPSSTPSKACKAFLEEWTKQINDHEQKHRDDNNKILAEHKMNWTPIIFRKCLPDKWKDAGVTVTAATNKLLREAATPTMDTIMDDISKEILKRAADFHASKEGGHTTPLDCNICRVKGDE